MKNSKCLKRGLSCLIAVASLFSCGAQGVSQTRREKSPVPAPFELRYTKFALIPGDPSAYELRIGTDRTVTYTGRAAVKVVGIKVYKLDAESYARLGGAIRKANFTAFPSSIGAMNEGVFELTIRRDGQEKTVSAGTWNAPWPKEAFELVWAIEAETQVRRFACPVREPKRELCANVKDVWRHYYDTDSYPLPR